MEVIISSTTAAVGATTTIAYWLRSSTSWGNLTREATTGSAHILSLSPLSAAASAAVGSGSGSVGSGNASAAPDAVSTAAYEGPLRTTFLGLFTFVAFASNLLLILAVAQSRTLRRTGFNVHLIGMAAANCLFCAVDMPLMIASSVAAEWQYGTMACSIFAFLHIASSVEYVLGMVCLAVDRLTVAKLSRSRSRSDPSASDFAPAAALTVSCWLIALAVGVPLLTSTVPVAWYSHRYMCDVGVGSDAALAYGAVVYACLFALPSLLVVLLLTLTASATLRDRDESPRRRDRPTRTGSDENSRRDNEGAGIPPGGGASRRSDPRGARGAVFVLLVFVLWILLKVPLVALASTEVYLHEMTAAGLPAQSEHVLSIVFVWLACAHCGVLPFAAFIWCRDIWDNFKDVLAWRRSAAAVGVARSGGSALSTASQRVGSAAPQAASIERFPARFKVPVLIATETGLHVHDDDNNNAAHAAPEAAGMAGGDRGLAASNEHDGRENRFIYADLTTRSYEITIERPAVRSSTLASGSDLTDDADEVADLSHYSDQPGALRALAASGIRTIGGGGTGGGGGRGGGGVQNSLVDGGGTSATPGQTNSLSTDSGVGSAAGSVSRENRKSKGRVRTRGPLLVRTGSQPPLETDEKGGGGSGGEPLPRIPLTLGAGWASWLPPEHVDYKSVPLGYEQSTVSGGDISHHGYHTTGLAEAVAVTETDAERQGRLKLSSGWAASETQPQPQASATSSRKKKRKKKQSKQASVASESAFAAMPTYNDGSDSTSQPLRPVRLAPLALSLAPIAVPAPAPAPAAAYGPLLTGPGRRVANSSETPF